MLKRRTPLKRSGSPCAKRKGTRRGQATPAEVREVREDVWERAVGRCELRLSSDYVSGILPWDGPVLGRGHLVHMKGRRMWGTSVDICKLGCWHCHLVMMHNPKPCPPKFIPEETDDAIS